MLTVTMKKGVKDLVAEANKEIKTIPVNDAVAKLDDPNTIFVDLRDVRELEREGMIPGAFHAPRGMIEFWVDPTSLYISSKRRKMEFNLFRSKQNMTFCLSAIRPICRLYKSVHPSIH